MKSDNPGRLELRQAAAPFLGELTTLAGTVPAKVALLVTYIRDHLFDQKLSVDSMKRRLGLRDNSIAVHFHHAVGEAPAAFIAKKRMAVASQLLSGTLLPVWKISDLLGYSSIQVFSRAYFRHFGQRPSEVRRRGAGERPAGEEVPSPPPAAPAESTDPLTLALGGLLSDQEAAELIRKLLEVYPPGRPRHGPRA